MSSDLAMALLLTLPVASLGILSTSTRHWGHFAGGSLSLACWHSCRRPGSWIPRVGTTTTATVSWSVACGMEMATTSATPGCDWSASSTSAGEMISPPLLITSLLRPVTYRYPSASIQPMSPVLNHPPGWKLPAVASGSFSYPLVTMLPLTTMCATRPFATRSPESSTMAISGQMACPELPARSKAYPGGGHAIGMHSVMPYDVSTAALSNTFLSSMATDGSKGPAALATNLILVFGTVSAGMALAELTTRMCMVGAP